MSGKLVFLVGLLGLGGYFGHTMMNYDPTVISYSKEQVETLLADARTTVPRRDGDGDIQIWGAGRTNDGVALKMQYSSTAPILECQAVVTELAPDQSRVVADCGADPQNPSAIGRTQDALRAPMFEEHIQATLAGRAFNRSTVQQKESAIAMRNLGAMQKEAQQTARDMAQMQAEMDQQQ